MLSVVWSPNNMVTVAILGGGISGLSAAYYLGKLAKSQAISKVNAVIVNYRPCAWPSRAWGQPSIYFPIGDHHVNVPK